MKTKSTQTKLSILELVKKLAAGESLELKSQETVVVTGIEMSDFILIANEEDLSKKLALFQQIIGRFQLALQLEGGVALGALNLDDRSWTLAASDDKALKISARPLAMRLGLNQLVQFLKKLPVGQGLVFQPHQDLAITGFSEQALVNYYEFSLNAKDPKVIEKSQDQFFLEASELLRNEGLVLKIFALDAAFMNREVSPAFGQISFKPQGNESLLQPKMVAALVKPN